ncbi:UDP-N-acetylmuramoyl-L-alanine--D-glutamate ligase [Synechococcales cyanobacterium C]|uniref:UDP-N-acetylmuramoylalanine--D-glutamate ligase n=1 Tax=Petrachloros mirabilis ULC683 TaxID=2781853 RepID=A0A8K1ZVT4_9CYAN|nr:UDP-N-acetylmuramoyl-L-alanine--D-glutamate ligase [Petrachloros mirabilis]NCJ05053.1 UDP-N-acetylmuramoyl-L-alanine--D-glutamate ligase [Petrachloros mirabilis ULC683]
MPTAHVIGLGRSGIAAARLLQRDGWQVWVSDTAQSEALIDQQQALSAEGIQVMLGMTFELEALAAKGLPQPERVVVSPGVSWQLPGLVEARSRGIETFGELELAWRSLQHCPWVGITGTNGKTTTTALVAAIFEAAGKFAPACGNIGHSACEFALSGKALDWVIAEVSSYQIEASPTLAPRIGAWTTLTPDHLERHGTFERYCEIKKSLLHRSEHRVLNGDDPYLRQQITSLWPEAWWTSVQGASPLTATGIPIPTVYVHQGWVKVAGTAIVSVNALKMVGAHNCQNLLMAVAVAHLAGIDAEAIATAVTQFSGVAHRLERVIIHQGVTYINDSKATNYDAAAIGLAAVDSPAILIAGGDPKVGDDQQWLRTIQAKAAKVLLIGKAAPAFAQRLNDIGYSDYERVETLDRAVRRAVEVAPQLQAKVVLLSPACASFDQYPNFEVRGDHFRELCLDVAQM